MKKKRIKKSAIIFLFGLGIILVAILMLNDFNTNSIKNNSYVKTVKSIKLYDKNKKVIGSIDKNIIFIVFLIFSFLNISVISLINVPKKILVIKI